jgi:ubiquinone/menaquinone biosynthesis C-methylase UbiE
MDSKTRFSDRVESYTKSRPGYPPELVQLLREQCGLNPNSVVADIGSGTGILSRMLTEIANSVYGVEPNEEMRKAGESYLAGRTNFFSVAGSAENTGLPATSVDLITSAQAFHWFDQSEARHEFMRVLKPNGFSALIWNDRKFEGSPFAEAYETLLVNFGTDYKDVHSRGKAAVQDLDRFFGHSQYKKGTLPNAQKLSREGFVGRVLSASYMPNVNHPLYERTLQEVDRIFAEYQQDGTVVLEYDTNVYFGQMT